MTSRTTKKLKMFKSHQRHVHSQHLTSLCADECSHIAERAGDAYEQGEPGRASKLLGRYTKCKRSCYIRRGESVHTRQRRRG